MTATLQQRLAASALVETLETIVSTGVLQKEISASFEMSCRSLLVRACRAFEIPTLAERPANSNADMDTQIDAVVIEMARP